MKHALHFVGFKNDRVRSALKVFGPPDFWHRRYDMRAVAEFANGDTVVFADGDESQPVEIHAWDDSANQ